MTHTYTVLGMHCVACAEKIKNAIMRVDGVTSAIVDEKTHILIVEMKQHITADVFNAALAPLGYSLADERMLAASINNAVPTWKKFIPLVILFVAIILFTSITSVVHGAFDLAFSMRMFMGAFFAAFGFLKLINLKAFAEAYSTYDIIAMRSRGYALIYPFLEALLALLYLADYGGIWRDGSTLILMTVSAVGVFRKLAAKEEIPCACLGMVFKVPMTWVTLIEDVLMAVEALIMIYLALAGSIY